MANVRGKEMSGVALANERVRATHDTARRLFGEPKDLAQETTGYAAVRRRVAEQRRKREGDFPTVL